MSIPRLFRRGSTLDPFGRTGSRAREYELYQEDEEFVLAVEMPGFDLEDIDVSWDEGVLDVAAEHEAETRSDRRTYHRRFRFPKDVDEEGIAATYRNGILEVRLPIADETPVGGRTIPVEAPR